MAIKKTAKVGSTPDSASTRAKVSVKKKSLKDLSAGRAATAVKGGANYTRAISGAL